MNNTEIKSNSYQSVIEIIANHSITNPDKLCVSDGKQELTYADVWNFVCGFAASLQKCGVKKGDCVVVECNQRSNYVVCEFAVQYLGATFVPLEKNAAVSRMMEIIRDTNAKVLVGTTNVPELTETTFIDIDTVLDARLETSVQDASFPDGQDVAEILFSTGTTGKSKGIVLTHRNDVALAENVKYGTEMKPDNIELIPMPLSHSHGLRRMYGNMLNGSTVILADGVMLLGKVFEMIDRYHVTAMDLSPTMLSIIFKLSKDKLGEYANQFDYIQLGSAPLAEEDKLHLCRLLPHSRLYNFYGSTEAGCSCILEFNSMSGRTGCIGKATVNAKFIVVDDDRNVIQSSKDNLGLLASCGDINMKEYFNEPELTAQTMKDGFIYTKDLGYIDEDGFIYMLGRKDDVINFGGIKISPEEIESVVSKHPIVKDCALVPAMDPITGQAPKLFIALEDGAEYDNKEFKAFLSREIDGNKQPKFVEVIDEIPRTFNGKIIRKDLINR